MTATHVHWMGKIVKVIPGVRYHGSGEATCTRFLSRKDGLVHMQNPDYEKPGIGLALSLCGLRYNIYRRSGVRGLKGIPTTDAVTCMQCILLEVP